MTLFSMYIPMMHLGMIIVPPGYVDPVMYSAGSPYGATAVTGPSSDQPPTDADLGAARFLGKRAAEAAGAFVKGGYGSKKAAAA